MTPPSTRLKPPPAVRARILWIRALWLGILGILAWASLGTELSPQRLVEGLGRSWLFIIGTPERPGSGFFPPDTSRLPEYISEMIVTVQMAIWGTALAFLPGLVLAILGAANTSPHPIIYQLFRRIADFFRGLNEFVLALIFVAAVGLGPFPGILALAIYTAGVLAKLFSEAIEVVEPGQVEAIRATGANALQAFTHGVWPQVVPTVVSATLYRFEGNVRGATVLGLVGAGGIGLFLTEAMRSFNFQAATTIILVILVAVISVDYLSASIRKRLT